MATPSRIKLLPTTVPADQIHRREPRTMHTIIPNVHAPSLDATFILQQNTFVQRLFTECTCCHCCEHKSNSVADRQRQGQLCDTNSKHELGCCDEVARQQEGSNDLFVPEESCTRSIRIDSAKTATKTAIAILMQLVRIVAVDRARVPGKRTFQFRSSLQVSDTTDVNQFRFVWSALIGTSAFAPLFIKGFVKPHRAPTRRHPNQSPEHAIVIHQNR